MPDSIDAISFKAAMRNLAGGVAVVATGRGDGRRGLTVTAACSVTVEPPRVLVCVNKSAEAHDFMLTNGSFSLNILSSRQQRIAEIFSGQHGSKGEVRFVASEWTDARYTSPILNEALTNLDCLVLNTHDMGSHTIFIGVVTAERHQPEGQALIYAGGRFGVPSLFDDPVE